MVRYSILRLLIFFGFALVFNLLGIKDLILLLGASAVASAIVSYLLLRGMRDEMTAKLIDRHQARAQARGKRRPSDDELAEDTEIEARQHPEERA